MTRAAYRAAMIAARVISLVSNFYSLLRGFL
jgi:hypothetical protein